MRDVMLDLETLSTRPDAMVVAVGAVLFGADGLGEEFYYPVSAEGALGHIDPATVAWWMSQGDEARSVFKEGSPLPFVLGEFRRFLPPVGERLRIWGHGSSFDLPIIESTFRACGHAIPWGHRAARDTRTILELAGVKVTMPETEKHNALSDAKAQARAVIEAANALGKYRLWPEAGC